MKGPMGPLPILRKLMFVLEMLEQETVIAFVFFICGSKYLMLRSSEGSCSFPLGSH